MLAVHARDRLDTTTVVLCAVSQDPCAGGNVLSSRVVDDYDHDDNDNRTRVTEDNRGHSGRTTFEGRNAVVIVNADGMIQTLWALHRIGWRLVSKAQ